MESAFTVFECYTILYSLQPPTFTPGSKKQRWSIPVTPHLIEPPPPPPSQDDPTHRMSIDSFESVESDSHSNRDDESDSHSPIPIPDNQTESATHTHEIEIQPPSDSDIAIQPHTHTSIHTDTQTSIENGPLQQATPTNYAEEVVNEEATLVDEEGAMTDGVQVTEREREGEGERGTERERRSALFDVEGDSEGNEEGSHALYEPTSPLQLMPTGILHDIAEETEGDTTEFEHSWNGREERQQLVTEEEVEYAETEFFDALDTTLDNPTNEGTQETFLGPVAPPPSLPVSPPPGPVLSPRLSMLLAETNGTTNTSTPSPHQTTTDYQNRQSVASLSGDSPPPPLPSSLPPGKLISPRHSLMDSDPCISHRPDSTLLSGIGTRLDAVLLGTASDCAIRADSTLQTAVQNGDEIILPDSPNNHFESHDTLDLPDRHFQSPDSPNNHIETESYDGVDEDSLLITTIDEVDDPPEEQLDESGNPLPPPLDDDDDGEDTPTCEPKLKITPSFLRSLEPPREFSDSGFPDTDHLSTPEQGTGCGPMLPKSCN